MNSDRVEDAEAVGPAADVIVVGAGAAGLTAAIQAKRCAPGQKIILLDSRQIIGAKILVSGGTRCNVTNRQVLPLDYHGGPKHFIKHVLEAFTPAQSIDFFNQIGVDLVLEPTGKYFPSTHSGKTVLEALLKEILRQGVELKKGIKISALRRESDFFYLESVSGKFRARRVILATGGLSYPETGSDGSGLEIARNFGHTIVPTHAALTPLLSQDSDWKSLSGVTLEAELSFFRRGKKESSSRGSFLFTHFGFSGPAALDISRNFSACIHEDKPMIFANFVPGHSEESLTAFFKKNSGSEKSLKRFLAESFSLPLSFVEIILKKSGLEPRAVFKNLTGENKKNILSALCLAPLRVTGVAGYKKAEVTAGGVDLKDVKHSSMESKKVPGLFFAGEILDVDGRIGGFNFQWAWSSGAVAGRAAAESLKA